MLKICDLTDVYEFAWCRAIINLLMLDPQDTENISWRKLVSETNCPDTLGRWEFQQTKGSAGRRSIDFLMFSTYQTVLYQTWFDGSLWGALQPWLFSQPSWLVLLLSDCSTSASSMQTYWTSMYTANLIWDHISI